MRIVKQDIVQESVEGDGPEAAADAFWLPPGTEDLSLEDLIRPAREERRDAAESRQRILTAARDLFARQGVEAVSMHQIAQAAGVGQGTLYRRYPHKGAVCFDLMLDTGERVFTEITAYLTAGKDTLPALERVGGLIDRITALLAEKASMICAMGESHTAVHRSLKYQNPFHRWMHGLLTTLFAEAVARGEAAPLDPPATADALLAVLAVDHFLFQREGRGRTPEGITAAARRLFVDGLRLS